MDKKDGQNIQETEINSVEFLIIITLAIFKDGLDWFLLSLTGIGLILSRITTIIIGGILWIWCILRLHKFPTKRFITSAVVEIVPLIGTFSPTWTIFVISIFAQQKGWIPKFLEKNINQ